MVLDRVVLNVDMFGPRMLNNIRRDLDNPFRVTVYGDPLHGVAIVS